jgi:hypothetical protein
MGSPVIRKLRREIKANPAKAAALGILFVVAIWFWIPLVQKWTSSPPALPATPAGGEQTAMQTNTSGADGGPAASEMNRSMPTGNPPATSPSNATNGPSSLVTTKTKPPTYQWRLVAQQIEQDPRMKPVAELGIRRDPFGPSPKELAAAAEKQAVEKRLAAQQKTKAPPHEELTPAAAGLTLSSTIVHGQQGIAMINGQAYHKGSFVPASDGNGGFVVADILPREILLERHGKRYQVALKSIDVTRKIAGNESQTIVEPEPVHNARDHE